MEHWSFQSERGLLPLDPAPIGPWQEGQNMYDWLASYGYARHEFDLEVGPLVPGGWKTYVARDHAAPWPYTLCVNGPGAVVMWIWLATFADWLNFLARYGPAVAALQMSYDLQILAAHSQHVWPLDLRP